MPLYECHCERCEFTFEVLAPVSEAATKSHPCPECGRRARRLISWVSFGRGGKDTSPERPASPPSNDVTNLKIPPPMQLCWMDKPSSARYAAYLNGRGGEYDETVAARTEQRKRRGDPETSKPHDHSHSPLSDPAVYARRRAAASKTKKASPVK